LWLTLPCKLVLVALQWKNAKPKIVQFKLATRWLFGASDSGGGGVSDGGGLGADDPMLVAVEQPPPPPKYAEFPSEPSSFASGVSGDSGGGGSGDSGGDGGGGGGGGGVSGGANGDPVTLVPEGNIAFTLPPPDETAVGELVSMLQVHNTSDDVIMSVAHLVWVSQTPSIPSIGQQGWFPDTPSFPLTTPLPFSFLLSNFTNHPPPSFFMFYGIV
jgi:hypothetical protein